MIKMILGGPFFFRREPFVCGAPLAGEYGKKLLQAVGNVLCIDPAEKLFNQIPGHRRASFKIASIGRLTAVPLIRGIAQKAHGRRHPSAILMYALGPSTETRRTSPSSLPTVIASEGR